MLRIAVSILFVIVLVERAQIRSVRGCSGMAGFNSPMYVYYGVSNFSSDAFWNL